MSHGGDKADADHIIEHDQEETGVVAHLDLQLVQIFGEDIHQPSDRSPVKVKVHGCVKCAVHHLLVELLGCRPGAQMYTG